jgi:branched-chain amino acid transport system ATP-binding protein
MLVVDRVRRSVGNVAAVRDVSFAVDRGNIFALLGPNGAGKTTTMRMILGIYAPDGGSISWNGLAIANVPAWETAVSLLVNVATVAASYLVAGRVYKVGMLLYGRAPSVRQIVAALRG